jgi:hypothetical protein
VRVRTTLLLAGLLLLLAGFYYYAEVRGGWPSKKEGAKLLDATTEAVQAVRITGRDTVLEAVRGEGGWQLTAPIRDRADAGKVDGLVQELLRATVERSYDLPDQDGKEYGLALPAYTLALSLKEKAEPILLEIGDRAPSGLSVYARRPGEGKVFLVPSSVRSQAETRPADLRDRTVLAVERDKVQRITLARGAATATIEREGKTWRLTGAVRGRGDPTRVEGLLRELTGRGIKEFVAEAPGDLRSYGLAPPVSRIALTTDEKVPPQTLLLGRTDKAKAGVYATRGPGSPLLLLEDRVAKAVPGRLLDLRDRTLLLFSREQVEGVSLASPKGEVELSRTDGKWEIAKPERLPADPSEVDRILSDLTFARAQEFLADPGADLKHFGLIPPALTVTLKEQGKEPVRLLLAAPEEGRATAAVEPERSVVKVEARLFTDLSKGAFDLRDRRLLPFDTGEVGSLKMTSGEATLILERRGGRWGFRSSEAGEVKPFRVLEVLDALRDLKWIAVAAERAEDPAAYGLAPPAREVTLWKASGDFLGTVRFGRREGERVFAQRERDPRIYAIPAAALDKLPTSAAPLTR